MQRTTCRSILAIACFLCLHASAGADDWQPLFNGRNLDGWQAIDGPMSSWHAEDKVLSCSGVGDGWLSTEKEYANFEIALEFRVSEGGNSGVFLRAPHRGNPAFAGMEIQILDDAAPEYAQLQPHQYCGSLYGVAAPTSRVSKPAGEWQTLHITCNGRRVRAVLNGTQIIDANLGDHQDKKAEHPGINRTSGFVGLQNHGTRVDFRNIKLRELP